MADPDALRLLGSHETRPRPSDGLMLVGHSWTRARVARHLGIHPAAVASHPHLLRLNGPMCLQEAYPCLQFDETGIRPDVALIGALARRRVADDEACDWLVRRHTELGGVSPLVWMDGGGSLEPLLSALPEPTRSPPGTPDDGTHEQVAAWIRRGSGGGPTRGADWWADYRERKGGPDPGPEVRVLLESLQRRNPDTAAHD